MSETMECVSIDSANQYFLPETVYYVQNNGWNLTTIGVHDQNKGPFTTISNIRTGYSSWPEIRTM